jgi:F-type H+-transporting ATPase subunit delta
VSTQSHPKDYARAIYELAVQTWSQQLEAVQKALKTDASLRAAMSDPGIPARENLERLSEVLPGGLDDQVRRFLGTLLESGQLDQLDAILVEFDRLAQHRAERRLARVSSAVPLTEGEKEALRARLLERFGSDLEFQFEVDASLIGGVRLRVGDQVIDGSIAGKLAALRDQLAA